MASACWWCNTSSAAEGVVWFTRLWPAVHKRQIKSSPIFNPTRFPLVFGQNCQIFCTPIFLRLWYQSNLLGVMPPSLISCNSFNSSLGDTPLSRHLVLVSVLPFQLCNVSLVLAFKCCSLALNELSWTWPWCNSGSVADRVRETWPTKSEAGHLKWTTNLMASANSDILGCGRID